MFSPVNYFGFTKPDDFRRIKEMEIKKKNSCNHQVNSRMRKKKQTSMLASQQLKNHPLARSNITSVNTVYNASEI